jgi:uncharacterized surface protein with fasciclin (FAS1) repeats
MVFRRTVVWLITCVLLGLAGCGSQEEIAPTATPTVAMTAAPTVAPATATVAPAADSATTETPPLADIITVIGRAEGLDQFVALAEQVGLTSELSGAGPLTILLPTNDAFAQLPATVLADPQLLDAILREHMIAGRYTLEAMAHPVTVTTLHGTELSLLVGQTGGSLRGANVLSGDYEVANGMIHIIDTVILPADVEAQVLAAYQPVAGETLAPMQGNIHIANNETSPIAYASLPPTSGPHYPNIAPWQVFEEPWRYEQLIHNLEDSGVVIYYQCPEGCPELVQQLRDFAQPLIDAGRHVLVAPNDPAWTLPNGDQPHQDMGAPIVVAAWRRMIKLDAFDADQIMAFIDAFEGIDHHVK